MWQLALSPVAEGDRTQRPWGWFETLGEGVDYRVKRLLIHQGQRISLQRHQHRSEHWVVVAGDGWMHLDGREWALAPGSTVLIAPQAVHRVAARTGDVEIIEVQCGAWLSEDDIERLSDDFGRCSAG